jgi:hypothetical protein
MRDKSRRYECVIHCAATKPVGIFIAAQTVAAQFIARTVSLLRKLSA